MGIEYANEVFILFSFLEFVFFLLFVITLSSKEFFLLIIFRSIHFTD